MVDASAVVPDNSEHPLFSDTMFKKRWEVKSRFLLRTSDKKKLRAQLTGAFRSVDETLLRNVFFDVHDNVEMCTNL